MEMIPTTPQQLWRTEFDKQYTLEQIRALHKHAGELIKQYRGYGLRSTHSAEDRINDALVKLFKKDRIWKPENVDLHGFLIGVVASDLSDDLRQQRLAPMISFDRPYTPREDDYTGEVIEYASKAAESTSIEGGWAVPIVCKSTVEAWEFATARLREMASKKKKYSDVLKLLDAYDDGLCTKRAVVAHLNWKPYRYRVAVERLAELAKATDPEVRDAIRDALLN